MPTPAANPAADGECVVAVVVTYNRRELLVECLTALAAQDRPLDGVIVVDNASTDGTRELLRAEHPDVHLLALPENSGGAGGFEAGLAAGHRTGADWIWLMDDDTIPRPDALAELLGAQTRLADLPPPLLLASRAVWDDGRLHPMNAPGFKPEFAGIVEASERGLLPLRTATFVSLLVRREAVDRYGLPHGHYFIWSDDIEYTARVLRHASGYLVPSSVVHHKTKTAYTAVSSSGGRFYYHVRNSLYMLRSPGWSLREKLSVVWGVVYTTRAYLITNAFDRASALVVLRGVRDGLRP